MSENVPFLYIKAYYYIFLFVAFGGVISCKQNRSDKVNNEIVDSRCFLYGICIDSLDVDHYIVNPGDNFSNIFENLGFSVLYGDSIYQSIANLIDAKKIRVGSSYYTLTTQDSTATIQYLILKKSLVDHVIVDFSNDKIHAYTYHKEVTIRQRYIEGAVSSSLWNELECQGVDPFLAIKIADIFAWEIDFFDLQEKDSFQILITETFIEDSIPVSIPIIDGVIFIHEGKSYTAIPFEQDSIQDYYNADGLSLRKAFLKAPLDYFRISSHFTNTRFHPILKRYRAHHGVDYAAPSGTPVKTIGSGKIIAKGYQRGGGNFVKIQHNNSYTTMYMHLKGFAKGIQIGKQVRQGDIIGFVGSTGLSTGPHLDFRVYKNGKAINPLKIESPPSHPIKAELMDSFVQVKKNLFLKIDSFKKKVY